MLQVLSDMQRETLMEEVKKCDAIGVEIDEVTDISNKSQLVCHLRLVQKCTFKTVFAKAVHVVSKTGEALLKGFREEIAQGLFGF